MSVVCVEESQQFFTITSTCKQLNVLRGAYYYTILSFLADANVNERIEECHSADVPLALDDAPHVYLL